MLQANQVRIQLYMMAVMRVIAGMWLGLAVVAVTARGAVAPVDLQLQC